jgi:hypothetical protein
MLESDLRNLFERQAGRPLPRAHISIPAARQTGRALLRRRRATTYGSPVLAVGAVIAVALAGSFAGGRGQPTPVGRPAAPKTFNPLVPYAAVTWYPYRPGRVGGSDWRRALLLRATSPTESTEVVLYASGQCTVAGARMSCGSTAAGSTVELAVSGPAPEVRGQPAYWTQYEGGDLTPLRPRAGAAGILAFQYARGGWAVAESTGTRAELLRVAASVKYGQTARLQFPFRLTGLPWALSDAIFASFVRPGPGSQAAAATELIVGSPADRPGTPLRDALVIFASTQTSRPPRCRVVSVAIRPVNGHILKGNGLKGHSSQPASCPTSMINGYRAYLNSPPSPGKQTLFVPDADGLYLYEEAIGPDAPLSPSAALAHHLQLLGPDPANWTIQPVG